MIPYIHVPDLQIGSSPVFLAGIKVFPISLHPFGLLVATGVLVGSALATRRARAKGYDIDKLNSFITWMLVSGFVLSHMIDEVFYHPHEIVKRPWSLLMVWEGLSSFGGFIGALIGIVAWKYFEWDDRRFGVGFARRRVASVPILPFADVIIAVFPVAWVFGRSGCSVVHDHPGARAPADALLAVAYPLAGENAPRVAFGPIEFITGSAPRYDLGLLELMFTVVVAVLVATTWKKRLPIGTYIGVVSLAYAPVRFVMDYFRVPETDGGGADLRYGSLTFAQWCCLALGIYAVYMLRYAYVIEAKGVDLAASVRRIGPPLDAPQGASDEKAIAP
jgi:phosphatidylglycerol---prolipoprotein diacylglyceryl transferase